MLVKVFMLVCGLFHDRRLGWVFEVSKKAKPTVKCLNCKLCISASSVEDKNIFICLKKYTDLLEKDEAEYWRLANINPQVLDKIREVNLFEEHECSDYVPRNARC